MSREQVCYHLPLNAMIETMRCWPQTMQLTSHLAAIPGLPREEYRIHLVVREGEVLSCTISAATGLTLQGERALEAVQCCGTLSWQLSAPHLSLLPAQELPGAVPAAPAQDARPRPRRRIESPEALLIRSWSHLQRQVFLLTDGNRSIAHIAALVGKSPHEVQAVLMKLAEHHLILFDEY